jgi:hypothetical protein
MKSAQGVTEMIAAFSRRMLHKLMHKRAERHAGCRIDAERLKVDPEYASAIRALARFTLDEELRTLGAMIERESLGGTIGDKPVHAAPGHAEGSGALVIPFRRQVQA